MIGTGDKDYIEDCWKYAESKNIKNYIVYQEKMEQKYLAGVYGLADFFLLPTEYEIFWHGIVRSYVLPLSCVNNT